MSAARLVNLVGTRCVDGNVAAMTAWYTDHVHQLFACEGLLEARLLLRDGAPAVGDAPECLCFYDFADAAAFADYEAGPVRAAAAADRALGWGQHGIEITLRSPWRRAYRRLAAQPATRWDAALLQAGSAAERPLAAGHAGALELYRAADGSDSRLLLAAGGVPRSEITPNVSTQWKAAYELLWHWTR